MKKTSITIKTSPSKKITYVMGNISDVFDEINADEKVREGLPPNSLYLERYEGEDVAVIGIYNTADVLLTEFLCYLTTDVMKQTDINY